MQALKARVAFFFAWVRERTVRSLRRLLLTAFAFGFMGALAFPPTTFVFILPVCFSVLVLLLRAAKSDFVAFAVGWSFAFGYFLLGLYWIAASMFVDIRQFWWAVPLAVAGLPAFFAIFYGLAMVMAKRIGTAGVPGAICVALCWFLADYARGHLLTGFPWNLEGYAWSTFLPEMQFLSLFGVYGLTLVTLVAACLPAALKDDRRRATIALITSALVLGLIAFWGSSRLLVANQPSTITRVRVVQPNIEQSHKWERATLNANFDALLNATIAPADKMPDLVVWPETASTFYLAEDEPHRRSIAASLNGDAYLVTGVIRRYAEADGKVRYANSLMVLDRTGRIIESYDKAHLVPFGEYIPFRRLLASLPTLANLGIDFTPGQGRRTLHLDGIPSFSPLICYEVIFPGEVALRDDRPNFLINITNDGWYGRTAGPYQHFAIARARAIEEGVPLVRSANTGISGVIDAYGRIVAEIGLGEKGYVDADLPQTASPTLFSLWGDRSLFGLFSAFVVLTALLKLKKTKPKA